MVNGVSIETQSSTGRLHVPIIGPVENAKPSLPARRSLVSKFESFPFIVLAILLFLSMRFSAILYRLGLYPRTTVLEHESPQLICL